MLSDALLRILSVYTAAFHQTVETDLHRGMHNYDEVLCFRLPHFNQQRRVKNNDGVTCRVELLFGALLNTRMGDGVQQLRLLRGYEGPLRKLAAVEGAVVKQNALAESFGEFGQRRFPGFDDIASDLISVDDDSTELGKPTGDRRFPTAHATG